FFKDLPKDLVQGTARAVQERGQTWSRPSTAVLRPSTGHGTVDRGLLVRGTADRVPAPVPPSLPSISAPSSSTTFRPGDRVVHPRFGEGVVVSAERRGDDQELTVAFPDLPIKRLLA